jgi:hypothetical protein
MKKITIDVDKKAIEDFIPELESGKYILPSFQRSWAWDEDDVKDLIDSIVNNYPIGTIIFWKPSDTSSRGTDPFSKPLLDVDGKGAREIFYVIDGQQRLTSLLLLFNNWKIQRSGQEIKCEIPIAYNPANNKFYKSKTRGINLSNLIEAFWFKNKNMLMKLMREIPNDQFNEMNEKINRILKYKIPVYIMNTYEENEANFLDMAEAFIRVNRYGVRIGNLELMLSFLAGSISGDIKDRIYKLYEPLYETFEIELQPVIRFVFSNFDLKQTQISKVEQFKANIEKIRSIQSLERDKIFDDCKVSMDLTVNFLKEKLAISNSQLLPSQTPIITIARYFYNRRIVNLEELDNENIKNIVNWFIITSFNGHYSSATDTKLDEDLEVVKSSTHFPFDKLVENMKKRKSKINISEHDIKRGLTLNVLRREGRAYIFILYLLLVKKGADDLNGRLLRASPLTELARHHIFPKDYLEKELAIDEPNDREILINNLGNITLINENINSEIGEVSPEEYMEKYIESAKKHFISTDKSLWNLSQYQTHLEYRVKEIYKAGREFFREVFE